MRQNSEEASTTNTMHHLSLLNVLHRTVRRTRRKAYGRSGLLCTELSALPANWCAVEDKQSNQLMGIQTFMGVMDVKGNNYTHKIRTHDADPIPRTARPHQIKLVLFTRNSSKELDEGEKSIELCAVVSCQRAKLKIQKGSLKYCYSCYYFYQRDFMWIMM